MLRPESEPSPAAMACATPHFVVGQDALGCWLAVETHALSGGIFKSREDALRFVGFETDHRPGAVEIASAPLQFPF